MKSLLKAGTAAIFFSLFFLTLSISSLHAGTTTRVSVATDGTQGNSSNYGYSSISADGRYVAFSTDASNLVPGDTNGKSDVFVHDVQTGQTTRVSVASDGTQGIGSSDWPSISADGRYVAFESSAENLVSGDTNSRSDIFVHDMQTGQTVCASLASDGSPANSDSIYPMISADGNHVGFISDASNLISGGSSCKSPIFIRNLQTSQTVCVPMTNDGAQPNSSVAFLSISGDGRYVAFESSASNITPGDNNNAQDVFVHDMQTGHTTCVSFGIDGVQGNSFSEVPSISADGRYVAFYSNASNLVTGDTNNTADVFVYDMQSGGRIRISVASDGTQGNSNSTIPPGISALSSDGHYVAFSSNASNLVPGDSNGNPDAFVYDMRTGQTTRVSLATDGTQGNGLGTCQSISADGRYMSFRSDSTNLVAGDTNGYRDLFVRDMRNVPYFTTQPKNQASCSGEVLTFTAAASGIPEPTYQWYNSSGSIPGATGMSYTTSSVGSYYCVATNDSGSTTSNTATLATGSSPTISISSSAGYARGGTVWDWGTSRSWYVPPVQRLGLTDIVSIAGSIGPSIALKIDGTVRTWGSNMYGQLGDGSTTDSTTPIRVPGLTNVTAIASGYGHNAALKSDGTVWTWGYNYYGQIGNGNTTDQHTPLQVSGLTGVVAIACGAYHTVALKSDGTIWGWGQDAYWQLGASQQYPNGQYTPIQVPLFGSAIAVSCGLAHTVALKSDGTVWGWGYNQYGQLASENTADQYIPVPVPVSGLAGVTAISTGYHDTVAIQSDGTVWAWGYNQYGQLGNGNTTDQHAPVQVSGLTGAVAIAAGYKHTIAIKNDGTIWAWGLNDWGQLGNGNLTNQNTPVQVINMTGVNSIEAAISWSSAVKDVSPVTLTASATGTPSVAYQWYRRSVALPGATGVSYSAVLPGDYYCIATTACGSATSNTVTVNALCPPTIITQPSSNTVTYPTATKLTIAADGLPAPTYQWYNSNGPISGATGASYTTVVAGNYYCVATNSAGSATSNTAVLTVNGAPVIKTIADDKLTANDVWVEADSAIVSAAFTSYFYIEADNRSSGIRVEKTSHGLSAGMRADITGQMKTKPSSQEKYIAATSAVQNGTGVVRVLGMANRNLGGRPVTGGQVGVLGGVGLNNIGLLVTTWGKVTKIGSGYVYINDGSAPNDGTGNGSGVRVVCNQAGHSVGDFMFVTGISSCFKTTSGDIARQIVML